MKRENPVRRREVPKVGLHSPIKEKEPQRAPETPQVDLVHWHWSEKLWKVVRPVLVPFSVIFVSLLIHPKQTVHTMLTWLKERFEEPSTYKGIAALAGAAGFTIDPDGFAVITAIVLAIIGLIDFFQDDKSFVKKNVDAAKGE